MNIRTLLAPLAGVALICASGAALAGPIYSYTDTSTGNETITQNNRGGAVTSITTSYDSGSQTFTWEYTVTDENDGFWLVVSPGPNPKGVREELAILYGDLGNNQLTAYEYSGNNDGRSYIPPNETLLGTFNSLTETDHADDTKTVSFSIDATDINAHFNGTGSGVAYAESLGVWFHPLTGSDFSYSTVADANGNFAISSFTQGTQGYYDTRDLVTTVPEPGVLSLAGLGLFMFGLSRRTSGRRRSNKTA